MTDQQNDGIQESTAEEDSIFQQLDGRDWLLAQFIDFAGRFGLSPAITLMVSGTMISGELISGRMYLEELARDLSRSTSNIPQSEGEDSIGESLSKSVLQFQDIYPPIGDERWEDVIPKPAFIHLRKARVFAPGGGSPLPANGILWRGKTASVDGFSFGSFQIS